MRGDALTAFGVEMQLAAVRAQLLDLEFAGPQRADGTGPDTMPLIFLDPVATATSNATRAAEWVDVCDEEDEEPRATSRDVLVAQVLDALAMAEPAQLRRALLRLAAVSVQWAYAIEQRTRAVESEVTHLPERDVVARPAGVAAGGVAGLSPAHRQGGGR